MDLSKQLATKQIAKKSTLTIGVFDGVHLGHLYLIKKLIEIAGCKQSLSGIITFLNHPSEILNPKFNPSFIMDPNEKILLLEKTGVDYVIPITFNQSISTMSAITFIDNLQSNLNMKGLVVGSDFAMGKNRETTAIGLQNLGLDKKFSTDIIKPQEINGIPLRSTSVRNFLLSGDIKNASKVLGRNFNVSGTVAHGEKRGRKLGYPTANLKTSTGIMLPSNGIYATFAFINGSKFMSATSIGTNPTFEGNTKTVETYILNFDKDIYGQPIKIEFIKRLRDEMKFSSVESLITQMDIDIIKIEKILKI
jgi:riboflavin kinase/FMN adenylyltransferase